MGIEDGEPSAEPAGSEGDADLGDGSRPMAEDASACIVRRLVIDPSRRILIDVPGGRATTMIGERVLDTGLAGIELGVNVGRRVLGVEATPPPEP